MTPLTPVPLLLRASLAGSVFIPLPLFYSFHVVNPEALIAGCMCAMAHSLR